MKSDRQTDLSLQDTFELTDKTDLQNLSCESPRIICSLLITLSKGHNPNHPTLYIQLRPE